jgi:hypothetical protein
MSIKLPELKVEIKLSTGKEIELTQLELIELSNLLDSINRNNINVYPDYPFIPIPVNPYPNYPIITYKNTCEYTIKREM